MENVLLEHGGRKQGDCPLGPQGRGIECRIDGVSAKSSSGYIIGPWADSIFLIGSPAVALVIALLASTNPLAMLRMFIVLSPAHLFLVLYRSHGNATVFKRFPYRFTVAPIALFVALMTSSTLFTLFFYVTLLWDVHHGYMQTFGIGRIYDAKRGNDPNVGRSLDMALNALLYLGPLLSGVWLLRYVKELSTFNLVDTMFFSQTMPAFVDTNHGHLVWWIIGFSVLFFAFYFYKQWQYAKQGYRMSPQKVALLVCTAIVHVWGWYFNPFGMGFFILNLFHAIQYFALVYWSERKTLLARLRLEANPRGPGLVLVFILLPAMLFGIVSMSVPRDSPQVLGYAYTMLCLNTVLETMHFWWDGFIWSVRKNQVQQLVPGQPALAMAGAAPSSTPSAPALRSAAGE